MTLQLEYSTIPIDFLEKVAAKWWKRLSDAGLQKAEQAGVFGGARAYAQESSGMLTGNRALMKKYNIKPVMLDDNLRKITTEKGVKTRPSRMDEAVYNACNTKNPDTGTSLVDTAITMQDAISGTKSGVSSHQAAREIARSSVEAVKPGGFAGVLNTKVTNHDGSISKGHIIGVKGLNNSIFNPAGIGEASSIPLSERTHMRRVLMRHEIDEIRYGQKARTKGRTIKFDNIPTNISTMISYHGTPRVLTAESDNVMGLPSNAKRQMHGIRHNPMFGDDAGALKGLDKNYNYGAFNRKSNATGLKMEKQLHNNVKGQVKQQKLDNKDNPAFARFSI